MCDKLNCLEENYLGEYLHLRYCGVLFTNTELSHRVRAHIETRKDDAKSSINDQPLQVLGQEAELQLGLQAQLLLAESIVPFEASHVVCIWRKGGVTSVDYNAN